MKAVVEPSDLEEVRRIALDYYGVGLDETQATEVIAGSLKLQGELLMCGGSLDTVGREAVSDAIVCVVMGRTKPMVKDRWGENHWHWPLYGSLPAYAAEFHERFKGLAAAKGYDTSKMEDGP